GGQQPLEGHRRVRGRPLGVVVLRQERHITLLLERKARKPLRVVGCVRSRERRAGDALSDCPEKALPFARELLVPVILAAQPVYGEQVRLVAQLKGDEL